MLEIIRDQCGSLCYEINRKDLDKYTTKTNKIKKRMNEYVLTQDPCTIGFLPKVTLYRSNFRTMYPNAKIVYTLSKAQYLICSLDTFFLKVDILRDAYSINSPFPTFTKKILLSPEYKNYKKFMNLNLDKHKFVNIESLLDNAITNNIDVDYLNLFKQIVSKDKNISKMAVEILFSLSNKKYFGLKVLAVKLLKSKVSNNIKAQDFVSIYYDICECRNFNNYLESCNNVIDIIKNSKYSNTLTDVLTMMNNHIISDKYKMSHLNVHMTLKEG